MYKRDLLITIIVTAIVGIGAFFGGVKYQQAQRPQFTRGTQGTNRANGFKPVNGEIISGDDKTITVKLMDGSSKIILLSAKTEINKAASASATELKTGERVAVFGQDNSDGSVTAQSIQLNPVLRNR